MNNIKITRCYANLASRLRQQAALKSVTKVERVPSYLHGATNRPLLPHTIGQRLLMGVENAPDKEAVVFCEEGIRKTYQEFFQDAYNLAAGLTNLGLRPKERIGIWGPNRYEWLVTQYATAIAGFCLVNLNPGYKTAELRYALQKSGVAAIISPPTFRKSNYYQTILEIVPELSQRAAGLGFVHSKNLPDLKHLIIFDSDKKQFRGAWDYADIVRSAGSDAISVLHEYEKTVRADDPVNIQFTSGTTGHPKAATLTHHNIVNNAYFTGLRLQFHEGSHRICVPNPLYHCMGSVCGALSAIVHQQTTIFPAPWFNATSTLKAIESERVTSLFGTPTMFIDVLNHPDRPKTDLSTLSNGMVAGAPCPVKMMERLATEMNLHKLAIAYGSTEISPMCLMVEHDASTSQRNETVGTVCEHVEVAIVDTNGCQVDIGTVGEIWVRGYSVMRGYWGDEAKTREDITEDRWFHTGDMGLLLKDGSVKISGRSKDMVIRGGENIYPAEIEQFLFKHPAVADVHVFGVPDERFGEELCAWIRLKPEHKKETTAEQIKEFSKGKIAHFKIPRYILFKEEHEFPMTVTGKVKKNELRELARIELQLGENTLKYNE